MKARLVGMISTLTLCVSVMFAQAPLPSWSDTGPKKAIVDLVQNVTKNGSADSIKHGMKR